MPSTPVSTGLTIAYDALPPTGTPRQGAPIVLIMGLGAQRLMWPEGLCQQLAALGHPVIRFDNRDVGESTRLHHLSAPPMYKLAWAWATRRSVGAPYGIHDLADDTVGLLDALDYPQAHVVGASLGGMVAQMLAIRHPTRVATLTSIMSTPDNHAAGMPQRAAIQALLRRPADPSPEAAIDLLVQTFRAIGSRTYPADPVRLEALARASVERGVTGAGFFRQLAAVAEAPDRRPGLAQVQQPSLVIHGLQDPLVNPEGGRATARALPHAELLMLDDMGHDLPEPLWPEMVAAIRRTIARAS